MPVYCTDCVYYSGGHTTKQKDEAGYDDYSGDECAHPDNMESITNYYGTVVRSKQYPAIINEDNDCPWHYNHNDYEPPVE